ncbi:MAG TPA: hypothetical protein VMU64_12705 [Acidimicrobiales bacterium]|nr:hypothetical protein [Acidimicrobiales bacterium]
MRSCPGQLVVHRDGTVAYCTEETAGRRCTGEDHPHRGGFFACRVVDGDNCSYCAAAPLDLDTFTTDAVTVAPGALAPVTAAPR